MQNGPIKHYLTSIFQDLVGKKKRSMWKAPSIVHLTQPEWSGFEVTLTESWGTAVMVKVDLTEATS